MSVIVNEVWRSTYFDSIVLMRIARRIMALPGVDEAGLFIGTPANKDILRDAGILVAEGAAAESTDLVLALRAADDDTAQAARAEARRLLDEPAASQASAPAGLGPFRTLRAAAQAMPDANLALISVPGEFAAVEARRTARGWAAGLRPSLKSFAEPQIGGGNFNICVLGTRQGAARTRQLFSVAEIWARPVTAPLLARGVSRQSGGTWRGSPAWKIPP